MLMRNARRDAPGDAYTQLARQYPSVVLLIDACFTAYSAVAHAYRLRRTRRILRTLDCHRLCDVDLTPEDLPTAASTGC